MDVNSVMSTYNMNSVWKSINQMNNSSSSTVPIIGNVDSIVQENSTAANYFGQTTSTELQNIYQQIEPNYGIPLGYDKNGNFTIPTNTALPTDQFSMENSNIISLLNSSNSASDNSMENIISQFNSIESGSFKPNLSSILSSNPNNIYNTVNTLGNSDAQSSNNIDTLV